MEQLKNIRATVDGAFPNRRMLFYGFEHGSEMALDVDRGRDVAERQADKISEACGYVSYPRGEGRLVLLVHDATYVLDWKGGNTLREVSVAPPRHR